MNDQEYAEYLAGIRAWIGEETLTYWRTAHPSQLHHDRYCCPVEGASPLCSLCDPTVEHPER